MATVVSAMREVDTYCMLNQLDKTDVKLIRVVVVEDYKLTRLGLCSILKADEGVDVVGEADNAERGIELVASLRPDVVLMDVGLPGISGIEATQRIKAMDENIKVVIYTSHEREPEVLAALSAGANAYCVKSNSPNRLVDTVKTVAEGAAWLDPIIADIALKLFQRPQSAVATAEKSDFVASSGLSERELEVLKLLVEGKSNVEIADNLIISVHTAKAHVCNILQKLAVNDRVQAAVKAVKEGLV